MGADVADFEPGWGGTEGVGALLQGGSPGGVTVQGRAMGPEPRMERALISFKNRVA